MFHHGAALGKIFGAIVRSPNSILLLGESELAFNHIRAKADVVPVARRPWHQAVSIAASQRLLHQGPDGSPKIVGIAVGIDGLDRIKCNV
jgi:hypothetical protein